MRITTKCIAFFLLMLCASALHAQKNRGKKIYLKKGGDGGVLLTGSNFSYNPGDTLVLRAAENPFTYVYLGGITGTKAQPLVLINEGGPVQLSSDLHFEHCQYIKVTGTGTQEKYGYKILDTKGTAVIIDGRSAHIEVDHFYVKNAAFGVWVKNEASCDTTLNNWVMDDISIHDYELHNIRIEGMYLGSTDANNSSRPVNCKGTNFFYKPSKLGNIKVYNGVIDGTGRPAIMLSNASVGMSEIYNNKVSNVGREFNDQQGVGISIGLYTRAYIHHNTVRNTYTWGIASLGGSGLVRIEQNKVDSSGYLDGRTLDWPQNIVVDTRNTAPLDSTRFIIINNTVSNPGKKSEHIFVGNTVPSYATGSIICNNGKGTRVQVRPGVKWFKCGVLQNGTGTSNMWGYVIWGAAGLVFLSLVVLIVKKVKIRRLSYH
jgi:hypothetical protein